MVIFMNEKSLEEVRKHISRKYIGKAGIHGVGVRRKLNAICIYLVGSTDSEQQTFLNEIEREALPYKVLKIDSERSTIT